MRRGVPGERREIHRLVHARHVVVIERSVGPARVVGQLGGQHRGHATRCPPRLRQIAPHPPRALEPLARGRRTGVLELDRIPAYLPDEAARKDVVAHVDEAARRQVPIREREEGVAHVRRHPRIEAVRDDIVERPERSRDFAQVALDELDVREPESTRHVVRAAHEQRRSVAAGERRPRHPGRHRQQVGAIPAADLEDARAGRIGQCESEQRRDRRESAGMAPGIRTPDVRDVLVGGLQAFVDLGGHRASRLGNAAILSARPEGLSGLEYTDTREMRQMLVDEAPRIRRIR